MYVINEVSPHRKPHLDEIVLAVLAEIYGGEKIKIMPGAKIVPVQLQGTEAEWLAKGYLPAGQLGGIFDDKDLRTGQRKQGTCCALEMARFLEVDRLPELQKLLEAVNRVDGSATASPSDLSVFIKNVNESGSALVESQICEWAATAVRAIIGYLKSSVDCEDFVNPIAVLESMIEDGNIDNQEIIGRLRHQMENSIKQIGNCLEVAFVMRAMKVVGISDDDATEWLYTALAKANQQQLEYLAAIEEIRKAGQKAGQIFDINPRRQGENMRGVLVTGDNLQLAKASRAPEFQFAVCIIRKSSNNVAVLPNNFNRLDMSLLRALIRLQEMPIGLRRGKTFEECSQSGHYPLVSNWHMMDTGAILNGTNSIAQTPTKISNRTLVNLARITFSQEGRDLFTRMTGTPVIREVKTRSKMNMLEFLRMVPVGSNILESRSVEESFDAGLRA